MVGLLISILVLAVVGLIPTWLSPQSYGSKLEDYISSHNPSSTYDVERLAREFDEKQKQGII